VVDVRFVTATAGSETVVSANMEWLTALLGTLMLSLHIACDVNAGCTVLSAAVQ